MVCKADIEALRASLKAGVQVVSAPQLFPTPAHIVAQMIALMDYQPGDNILEPSAGTGNIAAEIDSQMRLECIEINRELFIHLCRRLHCGAWNYQQKHKHHATEGDFLAMSPEDLGRFDHILMNPPFHYDEDIKHIKHATTFLEPGGRLIAICANGPRQRKVLKPLAEKSGGGYGPLPHNSFESQGTSVRTALLVIEG